MERRRPRAGAIEGSRGRHRENRGSTPAAVSYEAEAAEIAALFRMKLAGLRRRLRPWEIPAAARALREDKQASLRALRERRAAEQSGKKELQRRSRAPPSPRPA